MRNIGITLGLWWLNTFEKSQFLFKSLKTIPVYFRYCFYILLTVALYFTITKLETIIDVRSYSIPVFIQSLLILIGLGIKIVSILFSMGIFAYESLYSSHFDVDSHFQEQKQKREFIKINQLEEWKLKNMHWFIRVLLYTTIWCFLYLLLEDILVSSFFNVYGSNPSKEIYIKFLYDYDFVIKCFIGIYLILVLILDYFVRKNQKSKKFPQETSDRSLK